MSGGYDKRFFDLLREVEDHHFWFRGRGRIIARLARQLTGEMPHPRRILELGCGNGGMLRVLRRSCPEATVVGMDLFFEGLRHARSRDAGLLVQGDVNHPPLGVQFDLIGMFDVIEHIPDHIGVLRSAGKILKPDGSMLITVPAHPSLWSYFDEASRHCRRYTPRSLREALESSGLEVRYLTQFMSPLYPIMWLTRRLGSRKRREFTAEELAQKELKIVPGINGLLDGLLALESRWILRRKQIPIGTSLLAIARRRPAPC